MNFTPVCAITSLAYNSTVLAVSRTLEIKEKEKEFDFPIFKNVFVRKQYQHTLLLSTYLHMTSDRDMLLPENRELR